VWWCTSEAYEYKKRDHNGGSDDFLFNCNIAWKKQIADLTFVASYFHMRFSRNILRANGGFDPK